MFPQSGIKPLDYGYSDTGERSRLVSRFFNQVYLWMAIGMMWTAVVSAAFAYLPALKPFVTPGLGMIALLGAFAVSWVTSSATLRMGVGAGIALFMLYATLIGFAIAPIWIVYKQATIGSAFLLTGGIFFVMSLIGFVTKIDLTKLGSIAAMIALGLFVGSIVNYFVASSAISWFITYAVVIVFPILIAYQTQALKEFALEHGNNGEMMGRVAILGALTLYIAFLNIFLSLLRILGDRR
jgi:FtsH-binding integral membrane protein